MSAEQTDEQDKLEELPRLVIRLQALLQVLRAGPLRLNKLLQQLEQLYPKNRNSARKTLSRDIEYLNALGIGVQKSATRPPVYTLLGSAPLFRATDLRTLALIRDTFGGNHPMAQQTAELLERLTAHLTEAERRIYNQRQATQAPLQPAIDYTPYRRLIEELEDAISTGRLLSFYYQSSDPSRPPTPHQRVEPQEIEYYDRQFYLVAYSYQRGTFYDFRVDRILYDERFHKLERVAPNTMHERQLTTFRYRLAARLAQGEISQRFHNQQVVERRPNGDVVIEAQGRSAFFIRRLLLKYADNAEVLEPAELRAQMIEEVRRIMRMYQT